MTTHRDTTLALLRAFARGGPMAELVDGELCILRPKEDETS